MKKSYLYSAFLMAMLATGFTSCSTEEFSESDNIGNREIPFSVKISKDDFPDETRTSLSENSKADLDCVWSANDQVVVSTPDGTKVGILTIMDGYAGKQTAEFNGSLTGLKDGVHKLNFTYLGTDYNNKIPTTKSVTLDYSSQEGTLASLSKKDLLFSKNIDVNVDANGGYAEDMNLSRKLAFVHFELQFPGSVKRTNETVTITSSEDMYFKWDFDYTGVPYLESFASNKGFSITGNSGNDIYMTIIPTDPLTFPMTFSVTIGGKTYTGNLAARTKDWKAGEYVRQGYNKGVPVEMKAPIDPDWVDFDLPSGLLWNKCNVGASSPEKSGNYYGWGDVSGTKTSNLASAYGPSNMPSDAIARTESSYGTTYYHIESSNSKYLSSYDIAYVNKGTDCFTPSPDDFDELLDNTTQTYTTYNGVYGYKFVSKTDDDKWIFIPCAGYKMSGRLYTNGALYLWSSWLCWYQGRVVGGSYNDISYAKRGLAFTDYFNDTLQSGVLNSAYGFPVRPVKYK